MPNLFQSFYRGQNVQHIEGTGLGLVIAKAVVELHNGTINVKSIKNQKTVFTIQLPLGNSLADSGLQMAKSPKNTKKLLKINR